MAAAKLPLDKDAKATLSTRMPKTVVRDVLQRLVDSPRLDGSR